MGLFGKDEYQEIYEQYSNAGFAFEYSKKHLGKSKVVMNEELNSIGAAKCNDDLLIVHCKQCGVYMNYISGWYQCPKCKARVRENTLYHQLMRENTEYLDEMDSLDDIPEGCDACGGPYPDCTDSCAMFD